MKERMAGVIHVVAPTESSRLKEILPSSDQCLLLSHIVFNVKTSRRGSQDNIFLRPCPSVAQMLLNHIK